MHLPKALKVAALAVAVRPELLLVRNHIANTKIHTNFGPRFQYRRLPANRHPFGGRDHDQGPPESIVVLDMAALDTIDALGAGDRVVGTATSAVPTWLKDKEGIDYSAPDLRRIAQGAGYGGYCQTSRTSSSSATAPPNTTKNSPRISPPSTPPTRGRSVTTRPPCRRMWKWSRRPSAPTPVAQRRSHPHQARWLHRSCER